MFQLLFSPGHIGTLKLRNRLIMPAMGSSMQDAEGFVTERMYHYHRVRAPDGVGMDTAWKLPRFIPPVAVRVLPYGMIDTLPD